MNILQQSDFRYHANDVIMIVRSRSGGRHDILFLFLLFEVESKSYFMENSFCHTEPDVSRRLIKGWGTVRAAKTVNRKMKVLEVVWSNYYFP